jgi:F-type H+-transporting ATPase subunit delta
VSPEDEAIMKSGKQVAREAKQLFRLCLRDGRIDEDRVRMVVQKVFQSESRGYLALLAGFHRLLKLEYERHQADIESAVPLPFDLRERIQIGLTAVYGTGLEWSFAQDTALIGGVRIKVGCDVYDSSIRSALSLLARDFGLPRKNGWEAA